jgi:DNA-binding transcriptional regulator GbsR (MarR family)
LKIAKLVFSILLIQEHHVVILMVKKAYPESIACYESLIDSSMVSFGLKSVDSKIYSFVYCSLKPVSLDDVVVGTGYSLATISTVAKHMADIHMLIKVKKPGTKKVFLKTPRNLSEMIVQKLTGSLRFLTAPKKESLPKLITDLKKNLRSEKNMKKKTIGKEYLKLLQQDLDDAFFVEELYYHIIDYIAKKRKNS